MYDCNLPRMFAVTLLASPLALLLTGEGTAAPGDGEVVLDPVQLQGSIAMSTVGGGPVTVDSNYSQASSSDGGAPISASQTVSGNDFELTVEANRTYSVSTRANFPQDVSDYLQITRTGIAVGDDTTELDFGYDDLVTIAGDVTLTPESVADSTIRYVRLYASASNTGIGESYNAYHQTTTGDSDYLLYMDPDLTGDMYLYGSAVVGIPVDWQANPVYRTISLGSRYVDLSEAGPYQEDFTVYAAPIPGGVNIRGEMSSLLASDTSIPGFNYQRVRDYAAGSWAYSPTMYDDDPAVFNDEMGMFDPDYSLERPTGQHQTFLESYWTSPYRYLQRPRVIATLDAGTYEGGDYDFNDPLAQLEGTVALGDFLSRDQFSTVYVEARAPSSGRARADVLADGSFVIPVDGSTWTPNYFYTRRYQSNSINAYFHGYDYSKAGVVVDPVGAPLTDVGEFSLQMLESEILFSVLGDDYRVASGYITGSSQTFTGCSVSSDPRYFRAYGYGAPVTDHRVTLVAGAGCYRFNAQADVYYDVNGTPADTSDDTRSRVYWSNVPLALDGQICEGGPSCEVLDDVTLTFDGGLERVPVSVAETTVGPETSNFSFGTGPDGGIIYYYIDVNEDDLFGTSAEVCIAYDDTNLTVSETVLRLYHYEDDDDLETCDEGFYSEGHPGWCDITGDEYPDYDQNVICGETSTFSPFAIFGTPDADDDGVPDGADNCAEVPNPAQSDIDEDGQGDLCDDDDDGDGVDDGDDLCPEAADEDQLDTDGDGQGDACDEDDDNDDVADEDDNCPLVCNTKQDDLDGDGEGDLCEDDLDGDGIADGDDSCPLHYDPTDKDTNFDGEGDACDIDDDGDGIADGADNCPLVANPGQNDFDGDGVGDACEAP